MAHAVQTAADSHSPDRDGLWTRHAALGALVANERFRYVAGCGLLAALYYGSARFGFALEFAGPVAAIVWLPVGIAIAFLYLGGLAFWPGVLVGDLLANDYSALPIGTALAQTAGNVLEVVVAVVIIRRFVRRGSPLDTVSGVAAMLVGLAAGTLLSATVGALAAWVPGVVESNKVAQVWRTWWLGDFSGALVVVPFALAWYRPAPLRDLVRAQRIEGVLLVVATAALAQYAFMTSEPLVFLTFPTLIWAALRFGQRGATLALVVTIGIAVWDTVHNTGPFAYHSITRAVLVTQLFIAVAALLALAVAAVVSERERIAERLTASRIRLVEAADEERRRIERNIHDGSQQRLTALAVRFRNARQTVIDPHASAMFAQTEKELQLAIDELRELAHGIHPATLRDFGLETALRGVAARAAVPVELLEVPSGRLDPTAEATAYYVAAEAVANAQRHAHASSIRVRVTMHRWTLEVDVADNGIGGATAVPGSGLQGLADRVEAIGGSFWVESSAGRGTRITAKIPVAEVRWGRRGPRSIARAE
jgi:signal transduction histidine kinase